MSKYFNQIIVITHTEDATTFPNIITVKMSIDNISSIEGDETHAA